MSSQKCIGVKGRLKTEGKYQCMKCENRGTVTTGVNAGRKENVCLEKDVSVECAKEFCYLGDVLDTS